MASGTLESTQNTSPDEEKEHPSQITPMYIAVRGDDDFGRGKRPESFSKNDYEKPFAFGITAGKSGSDILAEFLHERTSQQSSTLSEATLM
jgi:hypothetical protein